jgi:hypothetical protein
MQAERADNATLDEKRSLRKIDCEMSPEVVNKDAVNACLAGYRHHRSSLATSWSEFDAAYFASRVHAADSLVQIAIQLACYRCMGRMPSVFEPVSLAHLPEGRLDFISPVSTHSRELVNAISRQASREQQKALLALAVAYHREEIRKAKRGAGHIGHLLALSALESPDNRGRGVMIQKLKERILARLDVGMALLIQRDVMASNGGASDAVQLFGTIIHRNNMLGVGYMIGTHALVVDIQANGDKANLADAFKQELFRAVGEIGVLAEGRK